MNKYINSHNKQQKSIWKVTYKKAFSSQQNMKEKKKKLFIATYSTKNWKKASETYKINARQYVSRTKYH